MQYNLIKRVKSHRLCHILLAGSKSQVLPTFKKKGLNGGPLMMCLLQFSYAVFEVLEEPSSEKSPAVVNQTVHIQKVLSLVNF